jgi:hypothetical protein
MTPIINRNPSLYGPGPLARRMGGIGARPPLHSLVIMASSGLVVSLVTAVVWKYSLGDNDIKVFEDYYKENSPK